MSGPRPPGFDTLSLHAGSAPDPASGARATPIHFTSSFALRDAGHGAALFNMEQAGHADAGISNPTNAVLEERVAALEGGVAGIATASGQAAMHLGLSTLAGAGDHIVASRGAARPPPPPPAPPGPLGGGGPPPRGPPPGGGGAPPGPRPGGGAGAGARPPPRRWLA
ncbi:hypothetical protein ABIB38_003355, partial [Massilia sp. UYP11]